MFLIINYWKSIPNDFDHETSRPLTLRLKQNTDINIIIIINIPVITIINTHFIDIIKITIFKSSSEFHINDHHLITFQISNTYLAPPILLQFYQKNKMQALGQTRDEPTWLSKLTRSVSKDERFHYYYYLLTITS